MASSLLTYEEGSGILDGECRRRIGASKLRVVLCRPEGASEVGRQAGIERPHVSDGGEKGIEGGEVGGIDRL